ncbi:MAG: DNA-binding response regulator [Bacteroidetes bacterium RIFCSPLOWO2_12_FULL_35_15]|nr:MAG: DNA-binding response regulator [Bacteroidetes bacterium RIFCSPLOWO2_12_FULL_35_15]
MKLLIIEDELSLLKSITDFFQKELFICETATTYNEGLEKINLYDYDCIILDINLPGGSGLKLLENLRNKKKQEGVVIISAKNSVDDKIAGLELGADDYLTKPFHLSELNARVKALLRRKYSEGTNQIKCDDLLIDLSSKSVSFKNIPLHLTKNEYQLLIFMAANKQRVISKQAIAEHLLGDQADNVDSYHSVYAHIKNIKKKLKDVDCPDCIKAVYGLGYKFEM